MSCFSGDKMKKSITYKMFLILLAAIIMTPGIYAGIDNTKKDSEKIVSSNSEPNKTTVNNNKNSSITANDLEKIPVTENKKKSNNEDKPAEIKNKTSVSLIDLFNRGGLFMWPILLFASIAAGFIIERFIFFKKSNLNPAEFIEELESTITENDLSTVDELCKNNNYIISKIILKGLKLKDHGIERVEKAFSVAGSIQVASLEKGLNILSALGNIVPMLGFLGTVSGMISAFSDIAAADQVNAKVVAGGIQEALLTSAAGLIVAIPTLFFYNYFVHRVDIFVSDIERLSADVIEKMIEDGNDKN